MPTDRFDELDLREEPAHAGRGDSDIVIPTTYTNLSRCCTTG